MDYVITDHDTIHKFKNFKVETHVKLVSRLKLEHLISERS